MAGLRRADTLRTITTHAIPDASPAALPASPSAQAVYTPPARIPELLPHQVADSIDSNVQYVEPRYVPTW